MAKSPNGQIRMRSCVIVMRACGLRRKKTEFKPNEGERFPVDFLKVFFICFAAVHFLVHFLETIGFFAGSGRLLSGKLRHMACFPILCPEGNFFLEVTFTKELSSQSFRLELFWFLAFPLHKKGLKTKRCTAGNPLQGFIWNFCPNAVKKYICSAPVHLQRFRSRPGTGVSNRRSTNV